MQWFDWIKLATLLNVVAFLWFVYAMAKKGDAALAVAKALRFAPGRWPLKIWWGSFLLCLSYRLGASATVSPEAVIYGLFPTFLIAVILIALCEARGRQAEADRQERAKAAAKSARAAKRAEIKNKPEVHPLAGKDVNEEGPVLR